MKRKIVALFCDSIEKDPVASQVWSECQQQYRFERTEVVLAGKKAFVTELGSDQTLWCVPTETVASYAYSSLASDLNHHFADADAILVVNWHAGNNAPNKIFCAHATSDVPTGIFGPTSSRFLSGFLSEVEHHRQKIGLDDWQVLPEASHWSGIMVGCPATEIVDVRVPVYDFEIGSYPEDFNDPRAHRVMAQSLGAAVSAPFHQAPSVLYVGGIHFEPSVAEALFHKSMPISFGHIVPNQWLVSGQYQTPGSEHRLLAAAYTDRDQPQAFVFHDSLKAAYKDTVRKAAALAGLPCFSHRKLRDELFLRTVFGMNDRKVGNASETD